MQHFNVFRSTALHEANSEHFCADRQGRELGLQCRQRRINSDRVDQGQNPDDIVHGRHDHHQEPQDLGGGEREEALEADHQERQADRPGVVHVPNQYGPNEVPSWVLGSNR